MGKYVFDVDGTLTAHPKPFIEIMKALKKDGHYIIVLTGSITVRDGDPEYRKAQLLGLGITPDMIDELQIACHTLYDGVGQLKGEYCERIKPDMVFEDSDCFIGHIKFRSPEIACLKVVANAG